MENLNRYLDRRGISAEQMERARQETQTAIDAYSLKQARKTTNIAQEQTADALVNSTQMQRD